MDQERETEKQCGITQCVCCCVNVDVCLYTRDRSGQDSQQTTKTLLTDQLQREAIERDKILL